MPLTMKGDCYLNPAICALCKGKCCRHMPGACYPSDFGQSKEEVLENLVHAFHSKQYSIDWYEGQDGPDGYYRGYYVRPRTKLIHQNFQDSTRWQLYDPSWGGECIFLTETGCTLLPEKRPAQCRLVEPDIVFPAKHCKGHGKEDGTKHEAYVEWKEYQFELDTMEENL